jgi:hypothetical protein
VTSSKQASHRTTIRAFRSTISGQGWCATTQDTSALWPPSSFVLHADRHQCMHDAQATCALQLGSEGLQGKSADISRVSARQRQCRRHVILPCCRLAVPTQLDPRYFCCDSDWAAPCLQIVSADWPTSNQALLVTRASKASPLQHWTHSGIFNVFVPEEPQPLSTALVHVQRPGTRNH